MTGPEHKPVPDEARDGPGLRKLYLALKDISSIGTERHYKAADDELKSLGDLIGLGTFLAIEIDYSVKPFQRDLFQMVAELRAQIRQSCVVTLEDTDNHIHEHFKTQFVPAYKFEEMIIAQGDDFLEDDNIEPINDGRLETGRVLYEYLAGAVNPYPRTPEAQFNGGVSRAFSSDGAFSSDNEMEGPFAALAQFNKDDPKS